MRSDESNRTDYRSGRYYVTVRNDDGDAQFLLGPYGSHQEAIENVSRGLQFAGERDLRAHWYSYGTARLDDTTIRSIFGL